jgi:hypothetical protein
MKLHRKLTLAGAGLALMAGSVTLVGTGVATAKGKVTGTGSVTCTSVTGELKFDPPLETNGATTGSSTTSFKGVLGDCSGGTPTPTSAKVAESTTTNDGNSCSGFAANTLKTGTTFTITWKAKPAVNPTTITFPPGDISVASNGEGFTLGGAKGTVTGTGSYPGTSGTPFSTATSEASTAPLNLETGLCAGGKPQKDIKIVSGSTSG